MLRQSLTISLEAQAISHPVVPDPKAEEEEEGKDVQTVEKPKENPEGESSE